jgi:hypothetical protein
MVDVHSHLARNTTASYGQHLDVYLDFFDAAPELDRELAMGTADMDLVAIPCELHSAGNVDTVPCERARVCALTAFGVCGRQ